METETYFDVACKVLGMRPDQLGKLVNISHEEADKMVKDAWQRIFHSHHSHQNSCTLTEDDILRFYTDHIEYTIFHLAISNHGLINKDYIDPGLFRKLKPYFNSSSNSLEEMSILDYGCGMGLASLSLVNLGCKNVFLADIGTPLFNIVINAFNTWKIFDAWEKNKDDDSFRCRFIILNGQHILVRNYDLIICTDVFEHARSPDLLLRHLAAHSNYIYMSSTFDGNDVNPSHLKENCDKFGDRNWSKIIYQYLEKDPIFIEPGTLANGLFRCKR